MAVATTKVVLGDRSLQGFVGPMRVRHVLRKVGPDGGEGFAVCSVDDVELGECVVAVGPDEGLWSRQLYFFLPARVQPRRLCAEDIAELALRASTSLISHIGPLVFLAHVDMGPNKQDMIITTWGMMTKTRRGAGAKDRDFASQLTSIEE